MDMLGMFQWIYVHIFSDSSSARVTKIAHNFNLQFTKNILQLHYTCNLIIIPLNSINILVNSILC